MNFKEYLLNEKSYCESEINKINSIKTAVNALSVSVISDCRKDKIIAELSDYNYTNLEDKLRIVSNYLEFIEKGTFKKDKWIKICIISKNALKHANSNLPSLLSIINILETSFFVNYNKDDEIVLTTEVISSDEFRCINYCIKNYFLEFNSEIGFFEWNGEDVRIIDTNDELSKISIINFMIK